MGTGSCSLVNRTINISGAYSRTLNVLVGFPQPGRKGNMKEVCKKKDCAYWRDTPLGDSHAKCMTCCHSSWLPKSDKDNYKPNYVIRKSTGSA